MVLQRPSPEEVWKESVAFCCASVVDKDVTYGGDVTFDVETLIELRQTLRSSSDEKSAHGMTRTEMEAYLRGASQMELGIERGDVVEKDDGPI